MFDSSLANANTALPNQNMYKDQTYTDAPQILKDRELKKNCTSSETSYEGGPAKSHLKPFDNQNKEFAFEKTAVSKKSSRIRNLGEFYEKQKTKTIQVMRKLQMEAQQKMTLFHSSITQWSHITEKLALSNTIVSTGSFIVLFVMMIYYLCGVSDGSITWWVGVELLGAIGMLVVYFKTVSTIDSIDSSSFRIYLFIVGSMIVILFAGLFAVFSAFKLDSLLANVGFAFVPTVNKSDKRKGVLSLFVLYSIASALIKLMMMIGLLWSINKFRGYKMLLDDEERIADTSKPEYHT